MTIFHLNAKVISKKDSILKDFQQQKLLLVGAYAEMLSAKDFLRYDAELYKTQNQSLKNIKLQ